MRVDLVEPLCHDEKLCVLLKNMGVDIEKLIDTEYVIVNNQSGTVDYILKDERDYFSVKTSAGVFDGTVIQIII